jgi:hypothetical protein
MQTEMSQALASLFGVCIFGGLGLGMFGAWFVDMLDKRDMKKRLR